MANVYILEKSEQQPQSDQLNRILGDGIGIGDRAWPTYEGQPMSHAITLDLNTVPDVKAAFSSEIRAISLFVSSLELNDAFEPHNEEAKVLFLTEDDIDSSKVAQISSDCKTFTAQAVDVPDVLFIDPDEATDEQSDEFEAFEENNPTLSEKLFSHAGAGPIWIQNAEHDGRFIFQFSENLVPMNLGDGGVMYVFEDTAFWNCF